MTTNEVFTKIVSEHKWYAPFMSAQQASRIKRLHHNGKHKMNFYINLFNKFGYNLKPGAWNKD